MECALCLAKNEGYRLVYQDELTFVVVNIEPLKGGHVMVLPKRHAEQLSDLHDEEARAFLQAIDRCFAALKHFSDEPPLCVVNGWKHRSQPHLHAHILPSKEDTRGLFAAAEGVERRHRRTEEELARMAHSLRRHFATP